MHNPAEFRKYAEECLRLAEQYPEEKKALVEMAKAWIRHAEDAEKRNKPD